MASTPSRGNAHRSWRRQTAADVATLVAAHLRIEPETPVVVKGDGAVPYSNIVQLMVLLQRAGAPSVGLMTDPPEN